MRHPSGSPRDYGWVSTCGGDLHEVHTVLLEEIITGAATSAALVFKYPPVVIWKVASKPIPIDMNTAGVSPRSTTQVLTSTGTSTPPIRIRSQDIGIPGVSIGPQKFRNAHPLIYFLLNMGTLCPFSVRWSVAKQSLTKSPTSTRAKRMDFGSKYVLSESPNFLDFGMSPANTPDTFKSIIVPTTRVGRLTNGSD